MCKRANRETSALTACTARLFYSIGSSTRRKGESFTFNCLIE